METKDQIGRLIDQLNDAWLGKKFEMLENLLDDSVIFLSPDLKESIQGKIPAVRSYRDFMEKAGILSFTTEPPAIQILKETVIAVSPFTIKYQIGGQTNHEKGTEILIFQNKDNQWLLCWRTICNLETLP